MTDAGDCKSLVSNDLDGDGIFDQVNWYLSTTIDLDGDDALIDVLADYASIPAGERTEHAWRLFEIPLEDFTLVDPMRNGRRPGSATHLRIWYENPRWTHSAIVNLQIAGFRFLTD